MGAPYSLDLRGRVVAGVADGMRCAEAAEHYPSSRHPCERQTHEASSRCSGLSTRLLKAITKRQAETGSRAALRMSRSYPTLPGGFSPDFQDIALQRRGRFCDLAPAKNLSRTARFQPILHAHSCGGRLGQPSTRAAAGGFGAGSRPLRPGKATTVAGTPRPLRECTP